MKRPTLLEASEWVFGSVVAVGCLTSLRNVWGFVWLPYQRNYAEGVVLSGVQRVLEARPLYPASRQFPVIINVYGPVYYHVGAWLLKWFGATFAPLRLLTMVSAVAVAGLVALLLHHLTASWKLSLSFGFLFLTLPVVQDWLPVGRVDMPGTALSLAGLYLYCRFRDQWYLGIPFFLGAIFCKYTFVAAPSACFLDLLIQKRVKQAAGLAGSLVLLSGLAFLGVQSTTGGGFAFDTLASHADPYFFERVLSLFQLAAQQYPFLFVLGIGLALRDLRKGIATLPSLYLLFSTLTLIAAGQFGSDTNYLFEWTAILCLCGGLSYHLLRRQAAEATALLLVPGVLTLFILLALRQPLAYPAGHAECQDAYAYVKHHPGRRILAEDVGSVVMAGKPVQLSDPYIWSWLVRRKGWSDAELQSLVRARAFDAVILRGPIEWQKGLGGESRWPLPFLNALQENYRPTRAFACQDAAIAYEPLGGDSR
ncbi:MAG: hypothetical protein WAO35_02685 [Terriglobia bacterium]